MNTRRDFIGMAAAASVSAVAGLALSQRIARAQESTSVRGVRRAAPREYPRVTLRDQNDTPLALYPDLIQNRIVVFNAAYAECTGICPLAARNLKRVHEMLSDRVGRDFTMCTLTLNPQRDTPERLKLYMQREGLPENGWRFLTGTPDDVEVVRLRLGFYDIDPRVDADRLQHTGLVTVIHDRYDWWSMTPALASPVLITTAIERMLRYA